MFVPRHSECCWNCSYVHMAKSTPWTIKYSHLSLKVRFACSQQLCSQWHFKEQFARNGCEKEASSTMWLSFMSSAIFRKAYSPEQLSYEQIILSWVFSWIAKLCVCYGWRDNKQSYLIGWTMFDKLQKIMIAPEPLNSCAMHLSEDYQPKQWSHHSNRQREKTLIILHQMIKKRLNILCFTYFFW